jgi:carbamate kinase
MKPFRPHPHVLVLTGQTIRLLTDSNLIHVTGGGGLPAVKKSAAGATCGDCSQ